MPTADQSAKNGEFVLGIDGCRSGWVVIQLDLKDGKTRGFVAASFAEILHGPASTALMTIVDMPIGLATIGRRACEGDARKLLSPRRHASVFSTPRRDMLAFNNYAEANAWGKQQGPDAGGGLSKQAWMIVPKIREVDKAIEPADQNRLAEGHPEIAFWRLNGEKPCHDPKRTTEGAQERLALLEKNGLCTGEKIYEALKATNDAGLARDDVYDAGALALTAKARLTGDAICLGDGALDARGLKMEIWG